MSMESLKKIGLKVLKLEHGNEALMDGQMELFLNEIIPFCNPISLLSDTNVYAMYMQNFIEIHLFILKI